MKMSGKEKVMMRSKISIPILRNNLKQLLIKNWIEEQCKLIFIDNKNKRLETTLGWFGMIHYFQNL